MKTRRSRLITVISVFILTLVIIISRLFYLYFEDSGFLQNKGKLKLITSRKISSIRGQILDKNNNPLAVTVMQYDLYGLKGLNLSHDDLLSLNLNPENKILNKKSLLKRDITLGEIELVKKFKNNLLEIENTPKRYYPLSEQASPLIGFSGKDNIGLEGLEKIYQESIQGEDGEIEIHKNAHQIAIKPPIVKKESIEGKDIYLTIDRDIQFKAYKHLSAGVISNNARGGSLIVLDNLNAEILAVASFPSYNPNDPQRKIQRNRAFLDSFEPGSLLKPIALAIGLDKDFIDKNIKIQTSPGTLTLNGNVVHDSNNNHGELLPSGVIVKSSQVGAAKIALKIGEESLLKGYKEFGFANNPYISFPSISFGSVISRNDLSDHEIASLGYGYNIEATALQIALAYSVIANGGIKKEFSLLKNENTGSKRLISQVNSDYVLSSLREAVLKGTGYRANSNKIEIAGKTGTAHKSGGKGYSQSKYTASFASIGPLSNRKYTVIVVIDEPDPNKYFGGEVAAPIAKSLFEDLLSI